MNWFFLFILMASLVACTSSPPAGPSSRKEASARESGQVQALQKQIRSRLERREFLKSLRLMQQEVHAGLSESSLAEEYRLALRGGVHYSEELAGKGQFRESGIYLRQLLSFYPQSLPAISGISAEEIRQRMNSCSDQLMARGLAAYRAGQMQQAIDFWTELLAFNPERTEAKKAIETCSIQLRNLREKPRSLAADSR
jgi:tetratricopeptide (TPR) repeat protein